MTAKQILILKSSPRKRANSSILADQVAAGARDAGAAVESFDLHSLNIRPCDACDFCQGAAECVINDDMQMLYPKLRGGGCHRRRQPDLLVHPQRAGQAVHRPLVRAGRSRRQRAGRQAVRPGPDLR